MVPPLYLRLRRFYSVTAVLALSVGAMSSARAATMPPAATSPAKTMQGDQKILHALNRLAFGPRPGDVERVREIGLGRWIEQQLAPATIDDTAIETKLAALTTLNMPPDRLLLAYAADTAGFIKMLDKQKQQQARQGRRFRNRAGAGEEKVAMAAMELNPQQRRLLEMIEQANIPRNLSVQAVGELNTAKLARAVTSNRQLQEVLVDFWSNHFNVDVRKNMVRSLKIVDDRQAIRPHVLGTFRELLGASAKSPAMLFYLDNVRSTAEMQVPQRRAMRAQVFPNQDLVVAPKMRGGLNENYARELMELHTLGVDGGYTQKDVQEVARCLTGWSINREAGTFQFRPFQHDKGEKTVLGQTIPAGGGISDGERVLDILASHPSTARYIARKLCVRFVSDEPPSALVDRIAKTFLDTKGDLKAVINAIVYSPEFFSTAAYRAKVKSPFEFAVSAVRALGGTVDVPNPSLNLGRASLIGAGATSLQQGGNGGGMRYLKTRKSLARQIALMGQPLFAHQAPNGYPENSQEWVSSGALIARLNFALDLTGGQVADATAPITTLLQGVSGDDHEATLDRLHSRLLGGDMSAATRATLKSEMPAPGTPANPAKLTALILGSPEFQRR